MPGIYNVRDFAGISQIKQASQDNENKCEIFGSVFRESVDSTKQGGTAVCAELYRPCLSYSWAGIFYLRMWANRVSMVGIKREKV